MAQINNSETLELLERFTQDYSRLAQKRQIIGFNVNQSRSGADEIVLDCEIRFAPPATDPEQV